MEQDPRHTRMDRMHATLLDCILLNWGKDRQIDVETAIDVKAVMMILCIEFTMDIYGFDEKKAAKDFILQIEKASSYSEDK